MSSSEKFIVILFCSVFVVIMLVLGIMDIVVNTKNSKSHSQFKLEDNQKSKNNADKNLTSLQNTTYCQYCGKKLKENESKCEFCGETNKRK